MAMVFKKTDMLTDAPMHYCPGCTHGIIHRLIGEAIDELGHGGQNRRRRPGRLRGFRLQLFQLRW